MIDYVKKSLPITYTTIEVANFDTQKMMNPEISGIEYQQGTLQGYEVREYLLEKWGRKCVYGKEENVLLEIEHIIPVSRGGTNRISNLTLACHDCNQKKGNLAAAEFGHPEVQILAKKSLKDAAFMNIVRWKLVNQLNQLKLISFDQLKIHNPNIDCTYGYITKYNRIRLELEKLHINDAFVISGGQNQIRSKPFEVKQIRRNNRSLQLNRKGFKPSIRRQRYKYSPGDLVLFTDDKNNKKTCIVKGIFNYGSYIRLVNPIPGEKDISTNIKNVRIVKYGKGFRFSYADSLSSTRIKETKKIETVIIENIETTTQYDIFGDEIIKTIKQSKKVEKKEKTIGKVVKTQHDIFGKIIRQNKSKKMTKIEESTDTTTQKGIEDAWN